MSEDMIRWFNNQMRKHVDSARAIADRADEEGRALTADEMRTIEDHTRQANEYKQNSQAERDKQDIRDALKLATGEAQLPHIPDAEPGVTTPRSIGEAFVRSSAYKALREKSMRGELGTFRTDPVPVSEIAWRRTVSKTVTPNLESDSTDLFGTGGGAGAYTTLQGLETPGFVQAPLSIADLLMSVPVSVGNSVTYPIITSRDQLDSGDVGVTEGAEKPSVNYTFETATEVLQTIAAVTKVSSLLIEDAPAIAAYINGDLPLQVRQQEDGYLAATLYDAGSAVSSAGDNLWEGLLNAMTDVQLAGFNATGIIISPADYAAVLAEKWGEANGYITGGVSGWGLPRFVVTQSATPGTALVGDFGRGAKVYRKGGLSIDSTNSDGDDFVRNLVTLRAEMRMVCGVTYPEAFVTVSV